MAERLAGKICLVTAAGQGIGQAIAQAFVSEGGTVWATDVDPLKLSDFREARTSRSLDVRSRRSRRSICRMRSAELTCWSMPQVTSITAPFSIVRMRIGIFVRSQREIHASHDEGLSARDAGARQRLDRQHSVGASSVRGLPNRYVVWRQQGRGHRARRNPLRPTSSARDPRQRHLPRHDRIALPGGEDRSAGRQLGKSTNEIRRRLHRRQPIGRIGTAEEVAMLALYLASDESSYTTGAIHLIDGGFSL